MNDMRKLMEAIQKIDEAQQKPKRRKKLKKKAATSSTKQFDSDTKEQLDHWMNLLVDYTTTANLDAEAVVAYFQQKMSDDKGKSYSDGEYKDHGAEAILNELKTTYKKHFRGTGADIWAVEDGWAIVGWAAGGGDSEFFCIKKAPEGYYVTRGYYSEGANMTKIYEDEAEQVPTIEAAFEEYWG